MLSYFSSSSNGAEDSNDSDCAAKTEEISSEVLSSEPDCSATQTKSSPTAASFGEAHDVYCTKHGTLRASIHQVLTEACGKNEEIPWALPKRNQPSVLVEANEVAEFLLSKRGNNNGVAGTKAAATTPQKQSFASSLLMSPLKVVSAVASMMRDPDDDVDEWIQEGDDALLDDGDTGNSSSGSSAALALNVPVANPGATEAAIRCLEDEIETHTLEAPCVMGFSEWNAWARSALSKHQGNKEYQLSADDNDFLLRVLVGLGKACIIRRQDQAPKGLDLVVLSTAAMSKIDGDSDDCVPEKLRIPVCLWDIQKAEAKIEKNLHDWSDQAAACTKKALQYKKKHQTKLATIQLAKRRAIQQRIDSDSRLQLQLLQTKNAIESAQSNRSMVDIMASSSRLLKQLREETPLEEIDDTMDDLQSELDDLRDVNNTLTSVNGNTATMGKDEEEELLRELEGLTVTSDPAASTPETKATPEKESSCAVPNDGTGLTETLQTSTIRDAITEKIPDLA